MKYLSKSEITEQTSYTDYVAYGNVNELKFSWR